MLYVFNLSSILLVLLFTVAGVKVFSLKKKKNGVCNYFLLIFTNNESNQHDI